MNKFLSAVGILTGFFSVQVASAIVRSNKGPAFDLPNTNEERTRTSQPRLLRMYAGFNSQNEIENISRRHKIIKKTREFAKKPFEFHPQDLALNYLKFGYKDESGNYEDWSFVQTKWGYCHGMTMVTRNFAYFAQYLPEVPPPYDFGSSPDLWMRHYEGIADQIMEGKITSIPGFRNLAEFSSSPIAHYLQRHVADQWGLNTARSAAFKNVFHRNFRPMSDVRAVEGTRDKLAAFLKHGFYPRVVIGPPAYRLEDPHVVMVTSISDSRDSAECYTYSYFNVGMNSGGKMFTKEMCVGGYIWIPNDEKFYMLDFARSQFGTNPDPLLNF